MLAGERHLLAGEEAAEDLDRLGEAVHPGGSIVEREAGRFVLVVRVPGADAQLEAPVAEHVGGRRFLGEDDINETRYRAYREGLISYERWVALDVSDWKRMGATRQQIDDAISDLRLVPGARETVDALHARGCALAVISGTLDITLDRLFPDHPFEEVYCNHIGFDEDGRIDHWQATPFDMAGKARALRAIALRESIRLDRCVFVGDSSNDVWVAREAGFTVALNPKSEELEKIADVTLRTRDLPGPRPWCAAACALVWAQVVVGVLNVVYALPVEVTGTHSAIASALVLCVVLAIREAWRRD